MIKNVLYIFSLIIFLSVSYFYLKPTVSGAPPYGIDNEDIPQFASKAWFDDWERPNVTAKVALQAGHYLNDDFPEELEMLRNNDGASGGGKSEWEVNLKIAEETKKILELQNIQVEILPATVPPQYWSDVFLAIHADGNTDKKIRGYKIASPWRDFTNNSDELVQSIKTTYEESTNLPWDDNISKNMRGYYAFSWWRFEHAIHPMTTAAIIETGFLTNYTDQKFLIDQPEVAAKGIAEGIINYLNNKELL